jgi:hypothetical protein
MTNPCQNVASVLQRESTATIERWLERVDKMPSLTAIPLDYKERTGHLPQLLNALILRLELEQGADRLHSPAAHAHGKIRFDQGYSVPMLVEESRLLQVSIFETLRIHQKTLDPQTMMQDVVTIADECDAQLKDTVETFMRLETSKTAVTPVTAR